MEKEKKKPKPNKNNKKNRKQLPQIGMLISFNIIQLNDFEKIAAVNRLREKN